MFYLFIYLFIGSFYGGRSLKLIGLKPWIFAVAVFNLIAFPVGLCYKLDI